MKVIATFEIGLKNKKSFKEDVYVFVNEEASGDEIEREVSNYYDEWIWDHLSGSYQIKENIDE